MNDLLGDPVPTAAVCDALMQLGLPVRVAPAELKSIQRGMSVLASARPVRHAGSTDLLLEAIDAAAPGEALVIDNGGRRGESCVGDMIAAEARHAGLSAIIVWGLHRDDVQLRRLGLPVYSCGSLPAGPAGPRTARDDALREARLGDVLVTGDDVVVADDDGVFVIERRDGPAVLEAARAIVDIERRQADALERGVSLRQQLRFSEYRRRQAADPTCDFRSHLREHGGAIEA